MGSEEPQTDLKKDLVGAVPAVGKNDDENFKNLQAALDSEFKTKNNPSPPPPPGGSTTSAPAISPHSSSAVGTLQDSAPVEYYLSRGYYDDHGVFRNEFGTVFRNDQGHPIDDFGDSVDEDDCADLGELDENDKDEDEVVGEIEAEFIRRLREQFKIKSRSAAYSSDDEAKNSDSDWDDSEAKTSNGSGQANNSSFTDDPVNNDEEVATHDPESPDGYMSEEIHDIPDYSVDFESMFGDGAENTSTNDGDNESDINGADGDHNDSVDGVDNGGGDLDNSGGNNGSGDLDNECLR